VLKILQLIMFVFLPPGLRPCSSFWGEVKKLHFKSQFISTVLIFHMMIMISNRGDLTCTWYPNNYKVLVFTMYTKFLMLS